MDSQSLQVTPSDSDIAELKSKIDDAKRAAQFENLKTELADITYKAINTPNEFEGAMRLPDTEKVLSTKRKILSVTEAIMSRLGRMLSPRPVIGSIISIMVAVFAVSMLRTELLLHHFAKYQHYIGWTILAAAGISVIKSGSRSLFLPVVATIAGAVISHSLQHGDLLLTFGSDFYQYMMLAGIIGLGLSVLNID